jgi:hypothetical protein
VAKPTFPIANYDGGLKSSYPEPEPKGRLVLSSDHRWTLDFTRERGRKSPTRTAPVGRYPLVATETGPSSCRVVVRDLMDPTYGATFDLPTTSAAVFKVALTKWARSNYVVFAQHMTDYEGSLLVPRVPEPFGMFYLCTDGNVCLAFPAGDEIVFSVWRFMVDATETGPLSCHVIVEDLVDPEGSAEFDLPETSAAAFTAALTKARSSSSIVFARSIAHYEGGLPGHPTPEPVGMLAFDSHGKWSLFFDKGSSSATGHLKRNPFEVTVTGSSSCQVTIRDVQNPTTKARFKLPRTSADTLSQAIAAVTPQTSPPRSQEQKPVTDRVLAPQVASPVSVADELKKFADLKDLGVLTDEEFAQQKARLLGL